MHSSHHKHRRQRGSNGDEDERVSRLDVSDPYSRPRQYNHSPDTYRPTTSSARATYMTETSSSRHHDEWRPVDPSYSSHERYGYVHSNDVYPRNSRDEYDVLESRDSDGWRDRSDGETHYANAGRGWEPRYDHGHSTSYSESASWTPVVAYDDRGSGHDHWIPEDSRGGPSDERSHIRLNVEENRGEREMPGWRRNARKDGRKTGGKDERRGGDPSTWRSDSGWESRRSESRSQAAIEPAEKITINHDDSRPSVDDRSWEPAPSWQPQKRSGAQSHGIQKGSRTNQPNKNSKGGKKNNSHNKQKRDWRTDDSNLNNWPKRDVRDSSPRINRTPQKRRQQLSLSRSRSRSPTGSYYSRRSSRGRSRSRSTSPTRRPRDGSIVRPDSHTPSDRGRTGWGLRKGREYSKSPSSSLRSRGSRGARRRSLSSASSSSRSRSSSCSPDRPRTKHRLPAATSIKDITLPISNTGLPRMSGMLPPRDIDSHRTKNASNGRHAHPMPPSSSRAGPQPPLPASMPPTSNVTSTSKHNDPHIRPASPIISAPDISSDIRSEPSTLNGHRVGTTKSAGFKPIGQTSSAVKRFFPDDDDDIDHQALRSTKHLSQVVPDLDSRSLEQTRDTRSRPRDDAKLRSRVLHDSPESNRHSRRQNMDDAPGGKRGNGAKDYHHRLVSPHRSPPRGQSLQENIPRVRELDVEIRDPNIMTPTALMPSFDRDGLDSVQPPSPPSHGSRGDLYVIISQVGEGTFGKVYKARNTVTKVYVALKRIRMESERDGFPVTAMREIKLLQSLRHQNIVRLYEMMVSNGSVYMVFEYMDHDLTGILSQTQFSFTDAHLKSLCHQMLAGLAYLHHKGVIHRDIKGSNILINNRGELKLADFGLARFYQKRRRSDYTNRVITLWYRPPELLFGATVYGPEVDMWSAGCIMLELFTKKPVFQGNDEIHQLDVIHKILGTPVPERWPGLADLPWYELVKPREVIHDHFRELFQKWLSPAGLDLAERLLTYDPAQRVTAVDALKASYFRQEDPPAALPVGLSTLEGEWHELETKRERAKKRRKTEPTMP